VKPRAMRPRKRPNPYNICDPGPSRPLQAPRGPDGVHGDEAWTCVEGGATVPRAFSTSLVASDTGGRLDIERWPNGMQTMQTTPELKPIGW
jgi:hypothetical protein